MDDEAVSFSLVFPAAEELEDLVAEAIELLDEPPALPPDHTLHLQAAQCAAALDASRRLSFGPFAQRALSAKVLRLKIDAVSVREKHRAKERTTPLAMPAAPPAWPDVDSETLRRAEMVDALPSDRV
jgi:hypothetical protein